MDDQAILKTYGNTDLPEGTEDRPLVTFALFAYNQEQYIREAVEGAFSQTYSPLEIILSDDCSSDRTFDIIEEMAREYRGPHRVVIRRNAGNLRLAEHINVAVLESNGDFIVVAAGDDISDRLRVETIAKKIIARPQISAVLSDYVTIPEQEKIDGGLTETRRISATEMVINGGGIQIGATYAYARKCFVWPSSLPSNLASEDRLLPFRAALFGEVWYLEEKLVGYRISTAEEERLRKSKRIHGYNLPGHWDTLRKTTNAALADNEICSIFYLYINVIIFLSCLAVEWRSRCRIKALASYLLKSFLRITRRMSIYIINFHKVN
ncbi:MAG: glycosyltransferase [Rhodobacteraceae bacterium]|nr:MAG: glycosyltransferase [Paracoccaceae bacterium]